MSKLINDPDTSLPDGWLSGKRIVSPHQRIRQAIRKKIMAEYESDLKRSVGWRRKWIKWKISLIIDIRYRHILFSGVSMVMAG